MQGCCSADRLVAGKRHVPRNLVRMERGRVSGRADGGGRVGRRGRAGGRERGGSISVGKVGWLSAVRAMGTLLAVPVQTMERPPPEAQGVEGSSCTKGVAVALAGSAAAVADSTVDTCKGNPMECVRLTKNSTCRYKIQI